MIAVYREHGRALTEAADSFHDRLLDLLVAIIARMWSIGADAAVTDEELRASGFDPSAPTPDPVDYL